MEELQLMVEHHNMINMPSNHLRNSMVETILPTLHSKAPIQRKATTKAMAHHQLNTIHTRNTNNQVLTDKLRNLDTHSKVLTKIEADILLIRSNKELTVLQQVNMNIHRHHQL